MVSRKYVLLTEFSQHFPTQMETAMNHPFFYLSIAALAPFYCIFFLSIIRDIVRGRYADGSDNQLKKPKGPTKKFTPIITSVIMAHWITGENRPINPLELLPKPLKGLSLLPNLSVN